MTAALLAATDPPPSLFDEEASEPSPEPTLEDVIAQAWSGLRSHRTVTCPVCPGPLAPRYGSGPAPVGARCRDCGTELT